MTCVECSLAACCCVLSLVCQLLKRIATALLDLHCTPSIHLHSNYCRPSDVLQKQTPLRACPSCAGDFPEWELLVQTMDIEKENNYEFDPLDATKTWPEDQFPLRPVGKMVLNKNVDNWCASSERAR